MYLSGSLVILFAAIGAVVCLFAGDYYYRYIDKKSTRLPMVEIPEEEEDDIELQWNKDKEDNIAA